MARYKSVTPIRALVTPLRWGLIPVAIWFSWFVAMTAGLALHDLIDRLCPLDQRISDHCSASWYPAASRTIFAIGGVLAATLILLSTTALAPSHKRATSTVVLVGGIVMAIGFALAADAWPESVAVILAGTVIRWAILRKDTALCPATITLC